MAIGQRMFFDFVSILFLLGIGFLILPIILLAMVVALQRKVRVLEARVDWLATPYKQQTETPVASPTDIGLEEPEAKTFEPLEEALESTPEPQPAPLYTPEPARPQASLEQVIGGRWLVWLGGLALALAGVFMVRYSIEAGLLGPGARIALGILLGLALTAGGEALRRRPDLVPQRVSTWQQIPAALTAAGLVALFAAVYSAHALYDLIPPFIAFVLLAVIGLGAQTLAYWHGPLVGLLGLVGAFAVPLLVQTGESNLPLLLIYLQFVLGASLGLTRWIGVAWMAWAALAASAGWALMWMIGQPSHPGDGWSLGLYLLALLVQFIVIPRTEWQRSSDRTFTPADSLALITSVVVSALLVMVIMFDENGTGAWTSAIVFSLAMPVFARFQQQLQFTALLGAGVGLIVATLWKLPYIPPYEALIVMHGVPFGRMPGPLVPELLASYFTLLAGLALAYGVGAGRALFGAVRPGLWSSLSGGMPILLLVIAYARISSFETDLQWSLGALLLAAATAWAAAWTQRLQPERYHDAATVAYAAATLAAISFAFAAVLQEAWLTVALSLQLPALAWIARRMPVEGLRTLALILAGVVMARLVLNPFLLTYDTWGWTLYGYGVPALTFYTAWRMFDPSRQDALPSVLEGGALTFVLLLLMAQIRLVVQTELSAYGYDLVEAAGYTAVWLIGATVLMRTAARTGRAVPRYGWRLLAGMAAFNLVFFHTFDMNPLLTGSVLGAVDYPVLNVLFLAYAVPALLLLVFAREAWRNGLPAPAKAAAFGAVVFGFMYITMEVRRAFGGFTYTGVVFEDEQAESYAYSAAWLAYALALLGVGLWKRLVPLRQTGLALMMLTVLKVFLIDMSELEGLLRVASFLGLGLSLLAIGYVYQRFVSQENVSTPHT